jgi:hypothetical protein
LDGDIQSKVKKEQGQLKLFQKLLSSERAYLLDSARWTKDVGILNQALDWLGMVLPATFQNFLSSIRILLSHDNKLFGLISISQLHKALTFPQLMGGKQYRNL